MLEEINKNDLSSIDIDYEKLGKNREDELDNIVKEVNMSSIVQYKFNEVLHKIYSGVVVKYW